jgi:WD repeat-containing protein 23
MDFKRKKSGFDYRCFMYYPNKNNHGKHPNDQSLMTFSGHKVFKTLMRCRYSPCYTGHRYVYTGSICGRVFIYDTKTGELAQTLKRSNDSNYNQLARDVSWHPKEPCLVSTTFTGDLNIYKFNPNAS